MPRPRSPFVPLSCVLMILILVGAMSGCRPAALPTASDAATGGMRAESGAPEVNAEWAQVIAAARREGKVVVIGPQGNETRDALTQGFQQRYPEIEVDYSPLTAGQIPPKLLTEQSAGQFLTDIVLSGTTPAVPVLMPAGAIVPVAPYLTGPDARDPSTWLDGKFSWGDDAGQYNLVFSSYVKAPFVYNPSLVQASEFKSWKGLLDPKWKGKMGLRDPNQAGGGQGVLTFWYTADGLGKDFIREFYQQDPTISTDDRQLLDWVARGEKPIAIGASDVLINEFISRGLPIKHMPGDVMQEGTYLTAGNGTFSVAKNAPHPNATRVYLDWLMSRAGQYDWSKAAGFASLRKDVPNDHVLDLLVQKEGVQYQEGHRETYLMLRDDVVGFLRTVRP